jgi:DNA-binding NtrC family response regulator
MSESITAPIETRLTPHNAIGRLLIIDDEAAIRESLETLLSLEGYTVDIAVDGEQGLERLQNQHYDLLLLDLALPGRNGIELLPLLLEQQPGLPVIMITAYGTVGNVVDAIRAGAENFVQKPWDNEKLLADIRTAIAKTRAEQEVVQLKRVLKQRYNFENIVGKSEPMLRLFDLIAQIAPSRTTVLIQGESGSGKELIAKALHANSPRRDQPFIPVNTGAMPAELLESTLFGHLKGSFTSAIANKKGLFEAANGGTLFLDEIATMSVDTQSKVLRVLQDRRFMNVGGTTEIQVDVRIIAATNVDLRQAVAEGRFREDLFYRLNVITLDLPPLRARREDIPLLAAHFLRFFAQENGVGPRSLSPETLRVMMDYDWPGNVRELENVIERCVVLSTSGEVAPDLLPANMTGRSHINSLASRDNLLDTRRDVSLFEIMEDIERRIISDTLERCNWNQTDASEKFKVPLSTLNQKIKRLNIEIRKKIKE